MTMSLVLLVMFALIVYVLQWLSKKNALNGVEYQREISKHLNAPDEPFKLITTITNNSFRIIPFVSINERLTDEVFHSAKVYLLPRARLVRRVDVSLPLRGRYGFTGATIGGGDFLGLSQSDKWFSSKFEVVIHPRKAHGNYIDKVLGSFLGEISVKRFIMPDPILITGFNEYTGREPMKAISWPQTLRSGKMMVKNYDFTTELTATVVVSLDFLSDKNDMLPVEMADLVEKCLSIAHTVCAELEKRKIKYEFYSNMVTSGSNGWDHVKEGSGSRHLSHILEGLGRAMLFKAESLEKLTMRVAKSQKHMTDKATVFIIPNREDMALQIIKQSGKEIKMVSVISADKHK